MEDLLDSEDWLDNQLWCDSSRDVDSRTWLTVTLIISSASAQMTDVTYRATTMYDSCRRRAVSVFYGELESLLLFWVGVNECVHIARR